MKTAAKIILSFLFVLVICVAETDSIRYLLIVLVIAITGMLSLFILAAIDCHRRSNSHYTNLGWRNRQKIIHHTH